MRIPVTVSIKVIAEDGKDQRNDFKNTDTTLNAEFFRSMSSEVLTCLFKLRIVSPTELNERIVFILSGKAKLAAGAYNRKYSI
jgi:hypothetical protein